MPDSLQQLIRSIRHFADERNWEQFHSPKNLSMALIVEAGELVEHFQCLSQEQRRSLTEKTKDEVAMELADILIYLWRLSDQLEIDLLDAAQKKIQLNGEKYPVERARNSAEKYTAWKGKE
jgi:NTP pyrophosphatase (non-canonical NTP hydrolase)